MWTPFGINLALKDSVAAGPTPLAAGSFKGGSYSIAGVSKTLAEVFVQNTDWAPFSAADIIPDVGYARGPSESGAGPVLTAEAFAAVGTEFVAVLTYYLTNPGGSPTNLGVILDLTDLGYAQYGGATLGYSFAGDQYAYTAEGGSPSLGTGDRGTGRHKAAFLYGDDNVMRVSLDGGAALSQPYASRNLTDTIGLYAMADPSASLAVIEGVEFFSLSDYGAADLVGLSAIGSGSGYGYGYGLAYGN